MLNVVVRLLLLSAAAVAAGTSVSVPDWASDSEHAVAVPIRGICTGLAIFFLGAFVMERDR